MNDDAEKSMPRARGPFHEVIIIGAGVSGIYLLHKMRELGCDVTLLEKGDALGGTWFWNRYPGARFDSESYTYAYSFDRDLLNEWSWSEHFAGQPETLRYLNFVADKFDLRRDMQFGCEVKKAIFDDEESIWNVYLNDGRTLSCRFLLTAIGMLSSPTMPRIKGIEEFEGRSTHTYDWPKQGIDLAGKKVAVIGTGATGVQTISEIADKVEHLTVFQRRPNWCAPLHNSKISDDEQAKIKESYDEIFERCRKTPGGFIHGPDRRESSAVSESDRLAFWEALYAAPGFGVWLGNFIDVLADMNANAEYSNFIADKIRARVHDPLIAEKLIPKDHGFGTRRVPLETNYYEVYNRDNVRLVDINDTPIKRITKNGIEITDEEIDLDVIVYATGFDAITGAFDRIEFVGTEGHTLSQKWKDGPSTYLGLQTTSFPNMFTLAGPQGGSVITNFPRGIQEAGEWVFAFLAFLRENNCTRVEALQSAENEWVAHVKELFHESIWSTAESWFTGYNSNVDGHDTLRYMLYTGGSPRYRETLADVASNGYKGFCFS